ncbi:MAG TPA: Na(+)/H(+) antiporter subunit D, partial [Aliiroseovarius sp.]|nr:Na(+)/H(+) antiporter subunit D [Aliiroseovarius sp.]
MPEVFPPAYLFFAAALILPFLPQGRLRGAFLLIVPLVAGWLIWTLPDGNLMPLRFMGLDLELLRVDKLARAFGLIFALAAFLGNLYAWHIRDSVQQLA